MTLLHPFLFALFLTASAYNEVRPLGEPREAVACALVLLLLAGALAASLRFGLKNAGKAALVTTVLLAFLGLEGELALTLNRAFPALARPVAGGMSGAFLALAALTLLPIAVILRSRRNLVRLNQTFLAASAALLATSFGGLWLDRRDAAWQAAVVPPPIRLKVPDRPPDIYFILFDAFTSLDSLRDFYGYDPVEFRAFLVKNGFQVADGARTEYWDTTCNLASRLNMRAPPKSYKNIMSRYDRNVMIRIIESSAAPLLLEKAGYKTVNLSMTSVGTAPAPYPLVKFLCYRSVREMLLERSVRNAFQTILMKMRNPGAPAIKTKEGKKPFTFMANKLLQPFADLEAMAAKPSKEPRFFFVHLMITHQPFVFNRDGSLHEFRNPPQAANADYLDQLIYATGLITQSVTRILQQSQQTPVIVLQGDHGFRHLNGKRTHRKKEGFSMLNAILLPGAKGDEVRDDFLPVNTLRLVFNHLFNAGFPYESRPTPPPQPKVQSKALDKAP